MKAILVVDDDCTLRSGIKGVMHYLFPTIEVLEAANGREGLAIAQEGLAIAQEGLAIAQTEQPGLILLDGNMPVMDGYEAAKLLKQLPHTCQTPLVGISGNNPQDPIPYGLQQLCDAWLTKPFTVDDLLLLIGHCAAT